MARISNKNISKTKLREAISSEKYLMARGIVKDTPTQRRKLERWKRDLKEKEAHSKPRERINRWW